MYDHVMAEESGIGAAGRSSRSTVGSVGTPAEVSWNDRRRPLSWSAAPVPEPAAHLGDDEERSAACVLLLLDGAAATPPPNARR
jgi:hypothetical protein